MSYFVCSSVLLAACDVRAFASSFLLVAVWLKISMIRDIGYDKTEVFYLSYPGTLQPMMQSVIAVQ
jgi:hypothetical protein